MIIDGHCHAGDGDGLTGPWDTSAPLARYLERATTAGIDRTVLLAAFHSDYAQANRQVAAIVRSNPRRFLGFAFVDPVRDRGRIGAMVAHAVQHYGFCGIKAHRHDSRMTREVVAAARAWRLPVLYDVKGDIPGIELLAREFADVNWIVPHLSSFADDWRAQVLFIDVLARHPNVYTDTSGVRRFDLLEEAIARAGAHKVIFGTDGPWLHPGLELAKVHALGLDRESTALIEGGNLLRLLARVRGRPTRPLVRRGDVRPLPAHADPWLAAPAS